jgi:hypothetical protein
MSAKQCCTEANQSLRDQQDAAQCQLDSTCQFYQRALRTDVERLRLSARARVLVRARLRRTRHSCTAIFDPARVLDAALCAVSIDTNSQRSARPWERSRSRVRPPKAALLLTSDNRAPRARARPPSHRRAPRPWHPRAEWSPEIQPASGHVTHASMLGDVSARTTCIHRRTRLLGPSSGLSALSVLRTPGPRTPTTTPSSGPGAGSRLSARTIRGKRQARRPTPDGEAERSAAPAALRARRTTRAPGTARRSGER